MRFLFGWILSQKDPTLLEEIGVVVFNPNSVGAGHIDPTLLWRQIVRLG